MTPRIERRTAAPAGAARDQDLAHDATPSLLDLLYDGFYGLFLMKNGSEPQNGDLFVDDMHRFLGEFERKAKALAAGADDIDAAKYAFCAAVDEIILRSTFAIRTLWERRPLQLLVFGDQLAGEHFYNKLEDLRARGSRRLQALEVFHMCLLLGFRGKYLLGGAEKRDYLLARLGDEIAAMKGKRNAFAPHAARPDHIVNTLRSDATLWILCGVLGTMGIGAYAGLNAYLARSTQQRIDGYNNLIKIAPPPPTLSVTLP